MRAAVIQFPGSNCDRDCLEAARAGGLQADLVWHGESTLSPGFDIIILPGGFTHGDYLRAGAIAAHSAIMADVRKKAGEGMPTLGICNGFQILCEAGLLPGALAPNATGRFACRAERLRVETTASPFLTGYARGQLVSFVTSNQSGRYVADSRTVERLNAEDRVAFRYRDADNGSVDAIAGVLSPNRRILGVMPHPDRAVDADTVGGSDGLALFRALTALEPQAA